MAGDQGVVSVPFRNLRVLVSYSSNTGQIASFSALPHYDSSTVWEGTMMAWQARAFRHLLLSSVAIATPAMAQDSGDAPPPVAASPATPEGAQSFTPADFARFSPKTALDMLRQVPGFVIQQADERRGLGQASANILINGERLSGKSNDIVTELRPDFGEQRHPHRHRRRRDARRSRPVGSGRQHRYRRQGRQRQLRVAPADPRQAHAGAADQRRSFDQRLEGEGRLHVQPRQRFVRQRQCRPRAGHHPGRHDPRSARRGARDRRRAAQGQRQPQI